ncbi:hypothetical protein [Streptomyces sp. NPDC001970]
MKIANQLCAEFGVKLDASVAYGDSMFDAHIFAAVPVAVAVNADHHLSELATTPTRGAICGRHTNWCDSCRSSRHRGTGVRDGPEIQG